MAMSKVEYCRLLIRSANSSSCSPSSKIQIRKVVRQMLKKPVKKSITLEVETVFNNDILKDKGRWNNYIRSCADNDLLKVVQVKVMKIQKS